MKIHILHLYPAQMNTYGDSGNLLTLVKRLAWHGIEATVHGHAPGDKLPSEIDLVLGGGGPDIAQAGVQADLLKIGDDLHRLVEGGVSMLLVCGAYQLFGKRFITREHDEVKGIGIFDAETIGCDKRLVGNVAVETTGFGVLYGFENHSGRTRLAPNQPTLGKIIKGSGNNGQDKTAGARTNNAIGTYLHGPVLPNNPDLADGLIQLALERKGISYKLKPLDDSLATICRANAKLRRA